MSNSRTSSSDAPFDPSTAFSIVAAILFGVVTCYHAFLFVKRRTWYLWWFVLAAGMETVAYCMRTYYAQNPYPSELRKFLISYILIVLAPFTVTIALFKTLCRITWYTTPPHKRTFSTTWIPTGFLASPFKLIYLGSYIVAALGAGSIVSYYSTPSAPSVLTGSKAMLEAAMVVQAIYLGLFAILAVHFAIVSRTFTGSALLSAEKPVTSWRRLLMLSSGLAVLMLLRTMYHVFSVSTSSPAVKAMIVKYSEVFLFTCDAVPMIIVFSLLAWTHPGHCLPGPYTAFWFSARKVKKMEKKVLETQTWPTDEGRSNGSVDDQVTGTAVGAGVIGYGYGSSTGQPPNVTHEGSPWPANAQYPARS